MSKWLPRNKVDSFQSLKSQNKDRALNQPKVGLVIGETKVAAIVLRALAAATTTTPSQSNFQMPRMVQI